MNSTRLINLTTHRVKIRPIVNETQNAEVNRQQTEHQTQNVKQQQNNQQTSTGYVDDQTVRAEFTYVSYYAEKLSQICALNQMRCIVIEDVETHLSMNFDMMQGWRANLHLGRCNLNKHLS
jgi:hypothetical protein